MKPILEKRLTTNGVTPSHLLLITLSIISVAVSLYSLNHFFQELYPTSLGGNSGICDISGFWNCDSAVYSPIASFFLVPISLPAIILGVYYLIHSLYATEESEKTGKLLATVNMIGCLILFFYSLIFLGSLCPVCSIYYLTSLGIFLLFWFKSSLPLGFSSKYLGAWFLVFIIASAITFYYHRDKKQKQDSINKQIVQQFFKLPKVKNPDSSQGISLLQAKSDSTAPIQVYEFSDFQCPYCKMLAESIEKAARQFPGKINATYFFYPLDASCNPNIKSSFHQHACLAAYTAYCSDNFKKTHDVIYKNQEKLGDDFLKNYIKDHKLEECVSSEGTKKAVLNAIRYADAHYQIKATPTLVINGVRLRALPQHQLIAIFREILKRQQ